MKRLLISLFVVMLVSQVFSQNTLTIYQKDGNQFSYGFEDKPVITYTDEYLVLNTTKTGLQYPLALLSKFTFTDVETAVTSVSDDNVNLSLDSYMVRINGAKADVTITVIGSDGKTIGTYKTDSEGSLSFSIAELPAGTYIIKSEDITCKILKK